MTWVKLDDGFPDHPKVVALSDRAFRAHVTALCYCARYLTDGDVPTGVAKRIATAKVKAELTAAGLWTETPGGLYRLHDYLDWNPSRADVEGTKENDRRRKAMAANPELTAAIKARDMNRCRYCGAFVNWKDRRSPIGGTYDHVLPISAGGDESFGNIVIACRQCNFRKGPRTPEQAGMPLRPAPGPEPGSDLSPDLSPEPGSDLSPTYTSIRTGRDGTVGLDVGGGSRGEVDLEAGFERFYDDIFPRKRARADALKAWKQVRRKGYTADEITAAATAYAADPNLPVDKTKIPFPSTWLRGERFRDGPLEQELTRTAPRRADAAAEAAARAAAMTNGKGEHGGPRSLADGGTDHGHLADA